MTPQERIKQLRAEEALVSTDIHSINAKDWYDLPCNVEHVKLLYPTFRELAKERYIAEAYGVKNGQ